MGGVELLFFPKKKADVDLHKSHKERDNTILCKVSALTVGTLE